MSRAPLAPREPLLPMTPLAPRAPLEPMMPLRPGESRRSMPPVTPGSASVPASAPSYQEPVPVAASPPTSSPPPPPARTAILQPPAGWTGLPRQRLPVPMGRSSGSKVAAVFALAIASLVALATIGSHTSTRRAQVIAVPSIEVSVPPLSTGGDGATAPSPAHAAPGRATPRSGRTLSLNGTSPGERIRVSFTRWVNDATSKDALFGPGNGKRYVAAQFRITNTGSVVYVDSPSNGARVIDSRGKAYRTTFLVGSLRQGKVFDAAVSLRTGRSAVGYLVFEVPKRARIARVQFSENSGFGQTGEWTFNRS
ncbi:MAG TPA: DUF4352 domain-containing protein [Mycobacteriales bacterium]|nr:DUF4352 domain-containing protein [Mycobacteriales bacterium]